MITNIASEDAVLAGLIEYGTEAFIDVEGFVQETTFVNNDNKIIFKCLQNVFKKEQQKVDYSMIMSSCQSLGFDDIFKKDGFSKKIDSLFSLSVGLDSVRDHAKKISRLEFARKLQSECKHVYEEVGKVSGDEKLSEIFSLAEAPFQKISLSYMKEEETTPQLIGSDIHEYVKSLLENKPKPAGIPSGFSEYDKAIGGGFRRKCVDLIGARPKALRYGSMVYTNDGPKPIEDIQKGDTVKHPFKGDVSVSAVWDHKNKDIYRIHFKDGDFVDCCDEHIWHVEKKYGDRREQLKTTKELKDDITYGKDNRYKWDIPLPAFVEFPLKELPLDPYFVGVLLGDGSVSNNTCVYHTADEEIHEYMSKYAKSIGCDVKIDQSQKNNKCISYRINSLQNKLRECGIFGYNCYEKFIPKNYIYNSKEVRLSVLAGLLDTDGDCTIDKRSKQSRTRFCSVSFQLCLDVKEIVQSLGGLCSINSNITKCDSKEFKSYRCEIRLPKGINPFRLKRKAIKFTERIIGDLKRTIIKIEKIGVDNARCLTLSEDDGLFMTDNYVVTHNTGKSILADNFALNISSNLNIPVLMLDTEMSKTDHHNRLLANLSGIDINAISDGSFQDNLEHVNRVKEAAQKIDSIPYSYISIAGKPFDEILSIARRWLLKKVGYDENGVLNDCLIVFDYLKLMDSSSINGNLAEFQVLGFQITALHNFCVEHDCPCVAFVQLNRDGITKETSDVASGSDRLVWLCTSFSIFKDKTQEEINTDGHRNGNKKIITVASRHGPGMEDEGYICLDVHGSLAKINEIGTIRSLKNNEDSIQQGFPDKEDCPFEADGNGEGF